MAEQINSILSTKKLKKNKIKESIYDTLEVFVVGVAIIALTWIFLAEPLKVSGSSMEPNLHDHEKIVAEKLSINFGELKRGDVIVYSSEENAGSLRIKRIVGLPNETIMIKEGDIYINGKKLVENYLNNIDTDSRGYLKENTELKIPTDSYMVLGDNRQNSRDSRDTGPVSRDSLVGKAVFVFYPMESLRFIDNIDSFSFSAVLNK